MLILIQSKITEALNKDLNKLKTTLKNNEQLPLVLKTRVKTKVLTDLKMFSKLKDKSLITYKTHKDTEIQEAYKVNLSTKLEIQIII